MNHSFLKELLESGRLSEELMDPELGSAELAGSGEADQSGGFDFSAVQVGEELFMTKDGHLVDANGEIVG